MTPKRSPGPPCCDRCGAPACRPAPLAEWGAQRASLGNMPRAGISATFISQKTSQGLLPSGVSDRQDKGESKCSCFGPRRFLSWTGLTGPMGGCGGQGAAWTAPPGSVHLQRPRIPADGRLPHFILQDPASENNRAQTTTPLASFSSSWGPGPCCAPQTLTPACQEGSPPHTPPHLRVFTD